MEQGLEFFNKVIEFPIDECGEDLVYLPEVLETDKLSVNYSDTETVPGMKRLFYLREGLIPRFQAMVKEFNRQKLILKIEDAYRNLEMQKQLALKDSILKKVIDLVYWETGNNSADLALIIKRLKVLVACCPATATHMSGSALDISILDKETGKEIDRGGPYLELSALTPMDSPFISAEARKNRHLISSIMNRYDFTAYPYEFWHYSSDDVLAGTTLRSYEYARYGPIDFDPTTGKIKQTSDPGRMLNTDSEILKKIKSILKSKY